jgi:ACS family hexuronate transporter-like MFS transporter
MSSTRDLSVLAAADREALGWRIWVPCIGMALCSWLSFVDRQVLAVLAPTILKDTGLSAQDFGNIVFFFFVAYTIANPLWGSILDFVGLRVGMLIAVALWSAASASHALMGSTLGFAAARALLGLGEGATFPGGLRTAVESLPANRRARGIATSFSGGTIGAILTPLIVVPIGLKYGWRTAFMLSGALGLIWLVIWFAIARPPYLPMVEHKPKKMGYPNPLELRFWALVASYALPAISAGPILTIFPLYFSRGMGVSQADLGRLLWMPPLAWGIGYFFWGWASDKFAADNPRPVGLMLILTVLALAFGLTTWTSSVLIAMLLTSSSTFVAGGFQMVTLKANSFAYPRDQAAMMTGIASGSWSLMNAFVSPTIGRMFDQQQWSQAFWLVALCPLVGVAVWLVLTIKRPTISHQPSPISNL